VDRTVGTYPEDIVACMVLRPTIEAAAMLFSMLAFDIPVAKLVDDLGYILQTHCSIAGNVSNPLAEPGLVLTLPRIVPRRSRNCRSSRDGSDRAERVLEADRVRQFLKECV
jgi:hypothetical protein